MRTIKFRGKSVESSEWFCGALINNAFFKATTGESVPCILDTDKVDYDCYVDIGEQLDEYEVCPESVSQYTGLTDKNGREIYEGDIADFGDIHGVVKQGGWYLYVDCIGYKDIIHFDDIADENDMTADFKVIGNVYEHSHLLEATK